MSIPCAHGFAPRVDRAVADLDVAAADVDAVELRARDGDAVEHDVARLVDVDPVLAADDGDVADRDAARANDDAAADDRARVADERLALVDHERPLVHAGREVHDRRPHAVRGAGGAGEDERDDRAATAGAGAAELAAVLRVGQPRRAGARRGRAPAPRASPPRKRHRRAERRVDAERARGAITSPSSSAPSGSASQPGWYVEQPVVDDDVEREADAGHQRASWSGHHALHRRPRAPTASASVSSTGASRDSSRPLSVYDIACTRLRKPRAAYFAPTSVSAAGNAHCACDAGERERPRLVGERRHVASGARTIQRSTRLDVVLRRRAGAAARLRHSRAGSPWRR